jgi:hypothetical protein
MELNAKAHGNGEAPKQWGALFTAGEVRTASRNNVGDAAYPRSWLAESLLDRALAGRASSTSQVLGKISSLQH